MSQPIWSCKTEANTVSAEVPQPQILPDLQRMLNFVDTLPTFTHTVVYFNALMLFQGIDGWHTASVVNHLKTRQLRENIPDWEYYPQLDNWGLGISVLGKAE